MILEIEHEVHQYKSAEGHAGRSSSRTFATTCISRDEALRLMAKSKKPTFTRRERR